MVSSYTLKQENPQKTASWISNLFFIWIIRLSYKGIKKGLEQSDLYKPQFCNESSNIGNNFETKWKLEVENSKLKSKSNPSLRKVIVNTFFWRYIAFGVLLFIQFAIIRCCQAIVLGYFIKSFANSTNIDYKGMVIFGSALALMGFINCLLRLHSDFGQALIGMRANIAVSSLVYRKMLKLSHKSRTEATNGMVVNLLSNDVARLDVVALYLNYFWIVPIQVFVVSYLIWREINVSAFAGILLIVVCTMSVQGYISRLTAKYRLATAQNTDKRVKLMNEIITGIEVIKLYAWEKAFKKLITLARKDEMKTIKSSSHLKAFYISWPNVVEMIGTFLALTCYVLLGNSLTPEKVFPVLQLFQQLQLGLATYLPIAVSFSSEANVSIKRVESFLLLEEKVQKDLESSNNRDTIFKDISAVWPSSNKSTLEKINFIIPKGTLCAIIGPVGVGKSSVIQVLLQELPILSGYLNLSGKISYSSQKPWIFGSSIKKNILFGAKYNQKRYKTIIDICALEKDLEQFSQRDQTLIGERGVSISGGQKIRINMARAVYREADIYVLDDPLSAVDTHVGKHLFEKCILEYLGEKTRILVTHQLQYLNKADFIIVVNNGKIEAQGTYEELTNLDIDFTKFLLKTDDTDDNQFFDDFSKIKLSTPIKKDLKHLNQVSKNKEEMLDTKNTKPLLNYLKSGGSCCILVAMMLIFVLNQVATSGISLWITFWTGQDALRNNQSKILESSNSANSWFSVFTETVDIDGHQITLFKRDVALYIYAILTIVTILITFLKVFVFFTVTVQASKNLHNKMFSAVLKVPISFFVTNPSGRILNRFSKDLGAIDDMMAPNLFYTYDVFLNILAILTMILISNYSIMVPILILMGFLYKLQIWYFAIGKNTQNLESIAKSPVLSHINYTFDGISTIRALQAENIMFKKFDELQDNHTSALFLKYATRSAFALWFDVTLALFFSIAIFGLILLNYYIDVNGSLVGLAVSQSLILTFSLQYGSKQSAELINKLNNVERVLQYIHLETETKTQLKEPEDKTWPDKGMLEFQSLYLRYSKSEAPVLHDISIVIPAKSKIGVVGRTGAGKSSLISALFLLVPIEGSIVIDGLNTKSIPLYYLRKKMSIIPQEPILFSASIRYNLDPFDEFEDNALWEALEEVELKSFVKSLDYMISESGTNLSVGQRQLVCLARAILRNNNILILDEATANVDPRTDSLIQTTIRKKFKNCTVLTIAHRLSTIMDSDKILVIDSGSIMEFDHPYVLLENKDSHFYRLVGRAGNAMMTQLKDISKSCYLHNIQN